MNGINEIYENILINIDQLIGKYKTFCQKNRIFVFASNNGLVKVEKPVNFGSILKNKFGLETKYSSETNIFKSELENSFNNCKIKLINFFIYLFYFIFF